MTQPTIKTALQTAIDVLVSSSDSPALDAEVLLSHILEKPRSYFRAWPERTLTADQTQAYAQLIDRRVCGEPIAHILGRREFWSLDFEVTPATLIPRPETERLVECALEHIPENASLRIADLGTGTGAIALSIARERPHCSITATDQSLDALTVAERNAERLKLGNVGFRHGDWYDALGDEHFDLIVSNPPYIRSDDPHLKRGDVRFDPVTALTAGSDGLDSLRSVVAGAAAHLRPKGWLLVEHGYDQAEAVAGLFEQAGFAAIRGIRDLGGQPRVTCGQLQATAHG